MRSMTSAIDAVADAAGAGLRAEREADASKIVAAQRAAAGSSAPLPLIGQMSETDMFARCVLVTRKGSPVVVLPPSGDYGRAEVLDMAAFVEAYRASIDTIEESGRVRTRHLTTVWRDSPRRIAVASIVVALGRARYIVDGDGKRAVNLWTRRVREKPRGDWEQRVRPFLEHVAYLVPEDAERVRFLKWLAHAEQHPEILVHSGYLFFTPAFGVGRNWLSSVLTRVWPGEVAASLDLEAMLRSGFNGALGGGVRMAIADEVRIAGPVSSAYAMEQRLRSIMTSEWLLINPKYGHQYVQRNTARWFAMTNHEDALPLTAEERRWWSVRNPDAARAAEYYAKLYAALNDPGFIDAIGWYLSREPLDGFDPGERPVLNEAKLAIIEATTSQLDHDLADLLDEWQAPVAASADLLALLDVESRDQAGRKHFGIAMRRAKWRRFGKVRVARGSETRRETVWLKPGSEAEGAGAVADAVREYRAAKWYRTLGEPHVGEPF